MMRRSSTDPFPSETGEHYFKTVTDNFYNGPNGKQQMKYLFNKIYKNSIRKSNIYGNQKGNNWETHKYEEINTLLNKQWVKEEIKGETRKYSEMSENENTKYRNM